VHAKRQEGADRPESVGLEFVDLLYAVPVAYLATRMSEVKLSAVTKSGWGDVTLALSAVTFGWIGHHANRKSLPSSARKREELKPFTTARFPQLVLEILIIAAYFGLVSAADLPTRSGAGSPSELDEVRVLAVAFILYLFWDLVDIFIAATPCQERRDSSCKQKWADRAFIGMLVTLVFMCGFLLVWHLVAGERRHPAQHVLLFDIGMVVLLLAYRIGQQLIVSRFTNTQTNTA
jgi:hypothetical protein